MATIKTIADIVLASGETNELTIYVTQCEKIISKKFIKITPPTSTANYDAGAKDTKIVDLLTIETRFTVNGYINSADESKIENLINAGGTFTMLWNSTTFNINTEKISITNSNSEEQDETRIMFTALVGVNL